MFLLNFTITFFTAQLLTLTNLKKTCHSAEPCLQAGTGPMGCKSIQKKGMVKMFALSNQSNQSTCLQVNQSISRCPDSYRESGQSIIQPASPCLPTGRR